MFEELLQLLRRQSSQEEEEDDADEEAVQAAATWGQLSLEQLAAELFERACQPQVRTPCFGVPSLAPAPLSPWLLGQQLPVIPAETLSLSWYVAGACQAHLVVALRSPHARPCVAPVSRCGCATGRPCMPCMPTWSDSAARSASWDLDRQQQGQPGPQQRPHSRSSRSRRSSRSNRSGGQHHLQQQRRQGQQMMAQRKPSPAAARNARSSMTRGRGTTPHSSSRHLS